MYILKENASLRNTQNFNPNDLYIRIVWIISLVCKNAPFVFFCYRRITLTEFLSSTFVKFAIYLRLHFQYLLI